ncbi:hypothetical protein HCH_04429 [Hahella chejuensis KCTC 2396]|uniref:Uncharacterized protein n=1 Tax=Hahella chejuensis (strain KCTC 2396) TaxID=349521 RepID=Q2SDZ0_HAHCH|nr:hypothetical protein HCH_04429 [Hahella chejuensis KCTC 2396]
MFFPFYYVFSCFRYFEKIEEGFEVIVFSTNMYLLFLPFFFVLLFFVDVFFRKYNDSLNVKMCGIFFFLFAFVVVLLGEFSERAMILSIKGKGYVECIDESESGYRSTKLVFKKDISACGSDI